MSISFSQFAYKKKPSVLTIDSSDEENDDDNDSIKCLGSLVRNHEKPSLYGDASNVTDLVSSSSSDEESSEPDMPDSTPIKKRKQYFDDSNIDDSIKSVDDNSELTSPIIQVSKRKRVQIIDSDESDDDSPQLQDSIVVSDVDEKETAHEDNLFNFINSATMNELVAVEGMSEARAEKIFQNRPYSDWNDLRDNYPIKNLAYSKFLENCECLLREKEKFEKTIDKCEEISQTLKPQLFNLNCSQEELPVFPPACLNPNLQLKDFQMIGLNWLVALSNHNINGILADQMGLGKTVQTLAFIGHLIENGNPGPHLIVCPTSTLDNWAREIETWLPDVSFVEYKGSQQERFFLSKEIVRNPREYSIIVTTINLLSSSKIDRKFFKNLDFEYLVVDEAHMVKNMNTERYKYMLKLNVKSKLLLTGTPLQNNVDELLALLSFLMPNVFDDTYSHLRTIFKSSKSGNSLYEKHQVAKLKKIMEPFVLRRLKANVLNDLPNKSDHLEICTMIEPQKKLYDSIIREFKSLSSTTDASKMSYLMKLRRTANHPLLMRNRYNLECLRKMASKYVNNPLHSECDADMVFEDMMEMSDFELHKLCYEDGFMKEFLLDKQVICESGKMKYLDELLPKLQSQGDRVLIFSQFVIMLDILESYIKLKQYKYTRFDGSTKGADRQAIIDRFNNDEELFIFLLSTKAGGVGINLTSANVVILHDLDFNPYNDKQAEDRCHRVGQKREVTVYKLLCKNTIDEHIYKCGQLKLNLEKELVGTEEETTTSDCKMVFEMASKEW